MRFPEFDGEWKINKIKNFGTIVTDNTPPTKDIDNYGNDYLWASPADLGMSKYITDTKTMLSTQGFKKTRKIPKGSILVTCIGSTIGKTGMAIKEMATNQQINSIIVYKDFDGDFVYYAVNSQFPKYLSSISIQAVPIISKSVFEELNNYSTSIEEQKKIGRLLSLLDDRISTQSKSIEDFKTLKTSLIDYYYHRKRNNNFIQLGDCIVQKSKRNKKNEDYPVLSVSNKYGFIRQSEQFENREVASDDTSNYKIVRENDFAYNPARINVSSVARLTNNDRGIVSPMYVCFHSKDNLLPDFLEFYFNSQLFKNEMNKRLEGSVRQCLTFESLCDIPICFPSIDEQKRISVRLATIQKKIDIENSIKNLFVTQKKYLLKQMFI